MMYKYMLTLGILLFTLSNISQAQGTADQQTRFIELHTALQKGKTKDYRLLSAGLENYSLYPYLEYEYLMQDIDNVSDTDLLIFLKRYEDSVLSKNMREKWLQRLAKQAKWERLLGYYIIEDATPASKCFYHEALLRTNNSQGVPQAKKQWASSSSLPDECDGMINALNPFLSTEEYWQRTVLSMQKSKVTEARSLMSGLAPADKTLLNHWMAIYKNPDQNLSLIKQDTPHARRVLVEGFKRLAKKKTGKAESLWNAYKTRFNFTAEEMADVENVIYAKAAKKRDPLALSKLSRIPNHLRDDEASLWMGRIAANQGDWRSLLTAISSMSAEERKDDSWVYWQARAKEALGQQGESQHLLQSIAGQATFHGFLAADRLNQPYRALHQPLPNRSGQIAQIRNNRNLQRALELYRIGKSDLALKEWLHTIKKFNKAQKLAAAELALQNGQAFTAILTVSKTKDWNVIDLRFPLLYKDLVLQHSRGQGIDPAWAYGVIRRESAFKTDALSRVKATGLMQLMPATAREVARSLKLGKLRKSDYNRPEINVQLGTGYLSQMLNKFNGSHPKATAAYNAGPGRIPQWAPVQTKPADQWIESIPFEETRKYVKAVMTYTTIYDYKLNNGQGQRMSKRLTPITPE
jgi:soluble lytic murein transglycosylase